MKKKRKEVKLTVKNCRRGKRNNAKNMSSSLRFLGVNAAGLGSKMTTFKKILLELKPSVFFVQETKLRNEGRLKLENYQMFELIRKNRDGGGLAIGCDKRLKPTWVREGNDNIEALSVDIFVAKKKIRCCVAYGCQESDVLERKEQFWNYLDKEVEFAKYNDAGLVIQFDGNLWAGKKNHTWGPSHTK